MQWNFIYSIKSHTIPIVRACVCYTGRVASGYQTCNSIFNWWLSILDCFFRSDPKMSTNCEWPLSVFNWNRHTTLHRASAMRIDHRPACTCRSSTHQRSSSLAANTVAPLRLPDKEVVVKSVSTPDLLRTCYQRFQQQQQQRSFKSITGSPDHVPADGQFSRYAIVNHLESWCGCDDCWWLITYSRSNEGKTVSGSR